MSQSCRGVSESDFLNSPKATLKGAARTAALFMIGKGRPYFEATFDAGILVLCGSDAIKTHWPMIL